MLFPERETSKLGRSIDEKWARSMRAVKGNLAMPSVSENMRGKRRPSLGLLARLGVQMGGRVRISRAVKGSLTTPSESENKRDNRKVGPGRRYPVFFNCSNMTVWGWGMISTPFLPWCLTR